MTELFSYLNKVDGLRLIATSTSRAVPQSFQPKTQRKTSTRTRPTQRQLQRATYTIEEAAFLLGWSKSQAYAVLANRGKPGCPKFPVKVIQLGERRYVVPRAALHKLLDLPSDR